MTEAEHFFLTESIAHARRMKIPDAVLYLRGLLQSTVSTEMSEKIRGICISLSESDRQLELLQGSQLKLNLPDDGDGHGGKS